MQPEERYLTIAKQRLRTWVYGNLKTKAPCIVLLHGGLDCLETWKDFPNQLALQTGLPVVAYERFGHGKSGRLRERRQADYRHHEAEVVLPEVLKLLGLDQVILVGHSDGAAMALMAVASLVDKVKGVCAIAPPLVPEKTVRDGILVAIDEYEKGNLADKLRVFHGESTDALFYGWAKAWLSKEFDQWSCAKDRKSVV